MNTINKKYELMKEICKFYGYEFKEENNKIICHHNEDYHYEYKSIDSALFGFFSTLIESNENHEDYNEVNPYTTWTKEEIDFIRGVITNNTVDVVFAYSQVLDIPRNQVKLEHDFDVFITSEKDGKATVNKMDSYCNIYIDEINNLISAEHDEDKKSSLLDMRDTMLDYKYMIKDYRAELSNIGKYVRDEIKSREFYENVNWEEFDEEVYANIGYNISQHKEPMNQLIDYSLDIAYEYSDWTFDLITKYVEEEIMKNGYTFDDNIDRFVKEKTVENLKNLLNSNSIEYETINLTEHKDDKVTESEILKVGINCSGEYVEVSIEDGNLEYMVVTGLNENKLEDHCNLTKYLFENDSKLVAFLEGIVGKIEEKCFSCKKIVSLEDKYDLQECPNCGEKILPQDSQSKIVVKEIYDVDTVNQTDEEGYDFQMYFDFENGDAINDYFIDWILGYHFIGCLVDKKDGVFDLDNCMIDMVWHGDNSEKFPFTDEQIRAIKDKVRKEIKNNNMGEIKYSDDEIEEEIVANMNTLQVKYDIDLQYKGTEFVGVVQCHKLECKGIPCVKDDKLELAKTLYVLKGERYHISFVEINNLIYPITDIKYWFGISSEDLFDEIQLILQEQEVPNSYIKISDKYYKVEKIEDILDIDTEGDIEEYEVDDRILNGMLEHYIDTEINLLIGDLESILKELDNNFDMLRSLLSFNMNLNDWANSVDIYCYFDYDLEEAYRLYLEKEMKLPNNILDYLDINSYMEKETTVSYIKCDENIVLYC